jgi:hypothetical protein
LDPLIKSYQFFLSNPVPFEQVVEAPHDSIMILVHQTRLMIRVHQEPRPARTAAVELASASHHRRRIVAATTG